MCRPVSELEILRKLTLNSLFSKACQIYLKFLFVFFLGEKSLFFKLLDENRSISGK